MIKITKLIIQNHQQFQDFEIDFCNANGEPLDRICLIGKNGTGKTTILKLLRDFTALFNEHLTINKADFLKKYNFEFTIFYNCLGDTIEKWKCHREPPLNSFEFSGNSLVFSRIYYNASQEHELDFDIESGYIFRGKLYSYFTHSDLTADFYEHKLPQTNLYEALKLNFEKAVQNVDISAKDESINSFWRLLIYQLQAHRSIYYQYLRQNEDKTVKEVRESFEKENPSILVGLAKIWNKILSIAGLEFDSDKVNHPATNGDNLEAFVKVKNTDKDVNYNELSTGIRDFMFKIGYLYSLYFNFKTEKIEQNFLFMDEPENGLYADFLYNYMSNYLPFVKNTQLFMATHSPILAAEFEPHERRILYFDEEHKVKVRKGSAPVGDDVNDILKSDFSTSVNNRHPKAKAAWDRYLELLTLISKTQDTTEKKKLVREYLELGQLYNFPAPDNLTE